MSMKSKTQKKGEQVGEGKAKRSSLLRRLFVWTAASIRFVTWGMWRLQDDELRGKRGFFIQILKPLYIAGKAFIEDNLSGRASALTYSTILSIVPMLAVLIGIAKGFGIQQLISDFLYTYLPSHHHELERAMGFVDNYLAQIQGGVFVGIGLLILLYTVFSLVASIEDTFNDIWRCRNARPWSRRIVDYSAMFIFLPVLITLSSGITLVMSAFKSALPTQYDLIGPVLELILKLAPFFIIILIFTGFYMALPNTRVRFLPAFFSAILAGIAFQIMQALYINGVIWISKYNAIYGSFAAIPLMFLFIQVSWVICLFGAQLSYSIQNVDSYAFEEDARAISRRYLDFLTLLVATLIVKRFDNPKNLEPYTPEQLSSECKIPIQLVQSIIDNLIKTGIIVGVNYRGNKDLEYYQPAVSPEVITVGCVLQRMDRLGSELFRVDSQGVYEELWQSMLLSRGSLYTRDSQMLLKDFQLDNNKRLTS